MKFQSELKSYCLKRGKARLTRNNDVDLDLPPRVFRNRTDADIFVSIHANASRGKRRDINGQRLFIIEGGEVGY